MKNFTIQQTSTQDSIGFCPTLKRCLFHQACVFRFGNEFCLHDPVPGVRKMVLAAVTCTGDGRLTALYRDPVLLRRVDQVVHLQYQSQLEAGVRHYLGTHISELRAPESEVFGVGCPVGRQAVARGFRGSCAAGGRGRAVAPPHHAWTVLARASRHCRRELAAVTCAFLYSADGLCLPPQSGPPSQAGHDYSTLPMLQLLGQIYRPHHHYVLHVDARADPVRHELELALGRLANVRVLPRERSFAASWASYNIVRAELEALEELLRAGLWDHALLLSGADLPLRGVDELAAALAAHRSVSFVSTFDGWKDDPSRPQPVRSQWFVLSREMAEFVTRLEQHPDIARRMFRFKNLGIPDEFVFSTLLFASPHRNAHVNTNLHYLKMFQPNNADGLCRHQDDADFCGRGPGDFTENDLHKLKVWGVPFKFFARKFATADPSSEVFPRFGSPSDHCRPAWQLWRTAVEQFVFWVDFSVELDGTAGAPVEVRARATGAPTVRCYPFGHLLAMGLGGGYRIHDNDTVRERRPPFPFLRTGVRRVTLALLFSVSGALRRQPDGRRPLVVRRRSNGTAPEPVSVAVTVADGGGAVWCSSRVNITLRSLKHSQDLNVTHGSQTATVDCRAPLPSNKYTARLVQDGVSRPYQYALVFHVVPRDAGEEYRHTADLWSVENAATLPLPDYYEWPLGRPVAAAAALTALLLVLLCLIASPRWWRKRRDLALWLLPAAALGYLTLRALAGAACERLRAGQAGGP
ncbi:Xylosyltransferase 1 [Amphibalanus amphitrite]|uniref:protein xylosyltransferase n=1 Tax=Amphibalanus amphitrite TaxID=1232801 RepID=A0A6A4VI47_AMPAM|nr:Xylosyltransferase 1 [Amphibalanus amphitrite]KAF0289121.1 Xylosyltransferase 1 [Amphibalanus amphitrite]